MSTTAKKKVPKSTPRLHQKVQFKIYSGSKLMEWRKDFGIARPMFAKIADCSERTLASYEKAPKIPEAGRRKIIEAVKLVMALKELSGDGRALKEWLQKPNRAFNKRPPIDLITNGESDVIWEMVHQLRQKSFA